MTNNAPRPWGFCSEVHQIKVEHFDDEQGPSLTFRRLLASGVSHTYMFTLLSTPLSLE